jgi:hypothetical protein
MPNVYMDTSSFATATALWSNATLTTKSPDGVYAICGYWRRQTAGVLEPGIYKCSDECAIPCGTITAETDDSKGWFKSSYDTGSALGAIRIEMTNISDQPVYYMCELGPLAFPDFSVIRRRGRTYSDGAGAGDYINKAYTFSAAVTLCDPEVNTITNLQVYKIGGGTWTPVGGTETEYVTNMTSIMAGVTLIMYIPKVTNTYSILDWVIIQPCASGYQSSLFAHCPVLLPEMKANGPHVSADDACNSTGYPLAVYQGHTNGTPGVTWGLYDWVFLDPYSEKIASDGWYKAFPGTIPAPDDVFYLEDGVIRFFASCPP